MVLYSLSSSSSNSSSRMVFSHVRLSASNQFSKQTTISKWFGISLLLQNIKTLPSSYRDHPTIFSSHNHHYRGLKKYYGGSGLIYPNPIRPVIRHETNLPFRIYRTGQMWVDPYLYGVTGGAIGPDTECSLPLSYPYSHPILGYEYRYWQIWKNDIRIL